MDATSADLGVTWETFVERLRLSRLLGEAELQTILSEMPRDLMALVGKLLASGVLTEFQLDALAQDRLNELHIGNYQILDKLGAGGMGTVFKARHRRMKRVVALKVLATNLCQDHSFVARFQREVETIARFSHPNIVMAYDADEAETGHFLVMEFVNGSDLASLVQKQGRMDVATAVDCMLQAARGLECAHAQNIVHRDVKPHNLLRDQNGIVKVTDLGLARLVAGDGATSSLTQAGGVLGTADYMSPEQAVDSTEVDHRTDIYSLGGTLYFLLTGEPPYSGRSIMSILVKHREAPVPSLAAVRPDVPVELVRLFERLMAKSPAQRVQTMGEVVVALEAIAALVGPAPVERGTPAAGANASSPSNSSFSLARGNVATEVELAAIARALTIFVIEPSRTQANIIRKYLESPESTITVFNTGRDALSAIAQSAPDAVVSALHLNDMTGIELATKVFALAYPTVEAIAPGFVLISSQTESETPLQLQENQRVFFLHKPFNPDQLGQAIQAVTGRTIVTHSSDTFSLLPPRASNMSLSPIHGKPFAETLRILIVDANADQREQLKAMLADWGISRCEEASDGARAIAALSRETFDVIITCMRMPLMDGQALIQFLKQTPNFASIPVLLVLASDDQASRGTAMTLPVAGILDLPYRPDEMKNALKRLFPA